MIEKVPIVYSHDCSFPFAGTSVRVTAAGVMKVQGIFISRLVEGGLAESTGLLAVNDEVLEVNGIEVSKGRGGMSTIIASFSNDTPKRVNSSKCLLLPRIRYFISYKPPEDGLSRVSNSRISQIVLFVCR